MSSIRNWEKLTPYTYSNQVKCRKLSISKFHALIVSISANQYINLIVMQLTSDKKTKWSHCHG